LRLLARDLDAGDFFVADLFAVDFFALFLKISSHPAANFSVEPVCTVYPVMSFPFLQSALIPS
jgi:hypothetical protein